MAGPPMPASWEVDHAALKSKWGFGAAQLWGAVLPERQARLKAVRRSRSPPPYMDGGACGLLGEGGAMGTSQGQAYTLNMELEGWGGAWAPCWQDPQEGPLRAPRAQAHTNVSETLQAAF